MKTRPLTSREIEYAELIAAGYTSKEIAKMYGISPTTVSTAVSNIFFKLGVNKRAALVHECMRKGIIALFFAVFMAPPAFDSQPIEDQGRFARVLRIQRSPRTRKLDIIIGDPA